jgi:cytochrome oxidase Cu insertion factor (SCO1/SenC/PrrC family)
MRPALVSCLLVLFVVCSTSSAQKILKNPPGIAVGKKAPDFELKNQKGKTQKLSEMVKKGPVAVVFHRSANW